MDWNERYAKDSRPDVRAVSTYVESPLWEELCAHLERAYGTAPTVEHSTCTGAPGWNLKYKKGGRALCTLYPARGRFTCLVSIGNRETVEAEMLLPACTDYLQGLYRGTKPFNGARWLMIEVTSWETLEDVKALIALRVRRK